MQFKVLAATLALCAIGANSCATGTTALCCAASVSPATAGSFVLGLLTNFGVDVSGLTGTIGEFCHAGGAPCVPSGTALCCSQSFSLPLFGTVLAIDCTPA